MIKNCKQCNNEFIKKNIESKKYWESKKYCSTKCSIYNTNINLEKGRVKGKKLSKLTKLKIGVANKGSNNYFWRGGKSNLKRQIINLFEYRQWRSNIFMRDNWTCQNCNIRGGKLEAHHIKSFSSLMSINLINTIELAKDCSELWDINNGQTLCKICHIETDNYGNKAKTQNGVYNT